MSDDSKQRNDEPSGSHPANIPGGLQNSILEILTDEQQRKLNILKIEEARKCYKYLNKHPDVRGLIVKIFKILMQERPNGQDIYKTVAKYFTKPPRDIKEEIEEYLTARRGKVAKNSTLDANEENKEEETETKDVLRFQSDILASCLTKTNTYINDNHLLEEKIEEIEDKMIEISISTLLKKQTDADLPVDYDDNVIKLPDYSSYSDDHFEDNKSAPIVNSSNGLK